MTSPAPVEHRLAKKIVVHRPAATGIPGAKRFGLTIDGEEFPFFLSAEDPVSVDVAPGQAPSVRFTVVAESVEVLDDYLVGSSEQ